MKQSQPFDEHSDQGASAPSGLIWIALAAVLFSFMTTATRLGTTRFDYSPEAAVLLCCFTQLIVSSVVLASIVGTSPLDLKPRNRVLLLLRGLFGVVSAILLFKSLSIIPAGEATAIYAFSPILTMMLSKLALNETSSVLDVLYAAVGMFGICMIAQPGSDGGEHNVGVVLVFLGACFGAAAYVCIRGMGEHVHFMLSVISLGTMGVPVCCFLGGRQAVDQILSNYKGTAVVFLGSLMSVCAQCCLHIGLQRSKAGQGVIMKNLEVPSAYFLAMLVLDERPAMVRVLGSTLVVSAVALVGVQGAMKST